MTIRINPLIVKRVVVSLLILLSGLFGLVGYRLAVSDWLAFDGWIYAPAGLVMLLKGIALLVYAYFASRFAGKKIDNLLAK